jgi:predicted nuclease of predicted toxin-antitoxin system
MLNLYADEQFPLPVVQLLRPFGHNVLTVQEAGKAGLGIPDPEVLAFAISNDRAVLTLNRLDFIGLHNRQPGHASIIVCTKDRNVEKLATRINDAIAGEETLRGKLIRVNRPPQ